MKAFTIMWSSYLPLIKEAADTLNIELTSYSTKQINCLPDSVRSAIRDMQNASLSAIRSD